LIIHTVALETAQKVKETLISEHVRTESLMKKKRQTGKTGEQNKYCLKTAKGVLNQRCGYGMSASCAAYFL